MSGSTALAPPLQLTCSSRRWPTRGLEEGSGPGVCWGLSRTGRRHPDRAYGPLGSLQAPLAEPLVHLLGQGSQIIEGGWAVSHEEVFDFLREPASVCTTKGDVVPSAVSCQGSELKCVLRDTPAPLFDRVEAARSISPRRRVAGTLPGRVGGRMTFVDHVPPLPQPSPGPGQLERT